MQADDSRKQFIDHVKRLNRSDGNKIEKYLLFKNKFTKSDFIFYLIWIGLAIWLIHKSTNAVAAVFIALCVGYFFRPLVLSMFSKSETFLWKETIKIHFFWYLFALMFLPWLGIGIWRVGHGEGTLPILIGLFLTGIMAGIMLRSIITGIITTGLAILNVRESAPFFFVVSIIACVLLYLVGVLCIVPELLTVFLS